MGAARTISIKISNINRPIEADTASKHDNKTQRLGRLLEINCSFNYTIRAVFYVDVIGGNNEATNHSGLMAVKPAHFCNCLINMPILDSSAHSTHRKNLRDPKQSLNKAKCIYADCFILRR